MGVLLVRTATPARPTAATEMATHCGACDCPSTAVNAATISRPGTNNGSSAA